MVRTGNTPATAVVDPPPDLDGADLAAIADVLLAAQRPTPG
jgi:hypothetical protein